MKSVIRFITIVLATVVGVVVMWQLRIGVWLFILSLSVAVAFRPPIKELIARGVPAKIALTVTYIPVVGIIILFLALISNPLLVEMEMATNEFTIAYQYILVVWAQDNPAQQFIAQQLPSLDNLQQLAGGSEFGLLQLLLDVTSNLFEVIGIIILVLLLSVHWTVDQTRFERLWLLLVPVEQRVNTLAIWRDMEANIGAYIRSEVVQAFLTGLSLYVGYSLLGLNYPILLALGGILAWFIPVIGPFLILIPVTVLGLTQAWWVGVGAFIFTLVLFLMMEWLVEPHFFNRRRFSGLLLLLVLMVGINLFGFIGLVLAPPLSVAIQIFFSHLIYHRAGNTMVKSRPDLQDVQQRLTNLQSVITTEQTRALRLQLLT